jgi:alpha-tubulin suppressor-like RCC1 family protein
MERNRRKFIRLGARLGGAVSLATASCKGAFASTWQKLALPAGSANSWRKLNPSPTLLYPPIAAAGGFAHSFLLLSNGTTMSCGYNFHGELGNNGTIDRSHWASDAVGLNQVKMVKCWHSDTFMISGAGEIYGTGQNYRGELGISNTISRTTFVQAIAGSNTAQLAAGLSHVAAIDGTGNVYSAGDNLFGQIGDNTLSFSLKSTFVKAIGISNCVAIAAGSAHTLALRSDGLVFAVGKGSEGQLGGNSILGSRTFIQCSGISSAIAVACGYDSSFVLRSDGTVFGCGWNLYGNLGDGTTTNRSTFVQATGISNSTAIASGSFHVMALRADGKIYGCGNNQIGQVADGSTNTNHSTYVNALGMTGVTSIACGYAHNIAIRADGSVWTSGSNVFGQLGTGTKGGNLVSFVNVL